MTLPSQTGRIHSRRSDKFRKKRLPRGPFIIFGVLALGLSGWLVFSAALSGSPENDGPGVVAAIVPEQDESNENRSPGVGGAGADSRRAAAAGPRRTITAPPSLSSDSAVRKSSEPRSRNRSDDNSAAVHPEAMRAEIPLKPTQTRPPTRAEQTRAGQRLKEALSLIDSDPVAARIQLTQAMQGGALSGDLLQSAIDAGKRLSDILLFSPTVVPTDPFAMTHTIKPGEALERIVRNRDLIVDWRFIKRLNNIRDVRKIRVGDSLKLITGPFHAIIDKTDYRLDLYLGDGPGRVYVRSFPIGLGEYNSTPVGMFIVSSRLENPGWINPRTRQEYLPDDPANPIGENWIGLQGVDEFTRDFTGYGIHGTVDPDSIGKQVSMGCVRMRPGDVAIVYETLMHRVSTVEIRE